MKEHSVRKYALFFLVILLVQDFAQLKYISRPHQLRIQNDNRERREISTIEEHHGKSRQRRGLAFATVALIGTLFVTSTSLAVEITLAIKGCCAPNPGACRSEQSYNDTKTEIEAINKDTEAEWELAQIKLIWTERTNIENERLWIEMERITEALEKIIFGISPELQVEMTKLNNELENAVQSGNETVQSYTAEELNANYPTFFKAENAYIPIIGYVVEFAFLGGQIGKNIMTLTRRRARARGMQSFVARNEALLSKIKNNPKAQKILGGDPKTLLKEAKNAKLGIKVQNSRKAKLTQAGSSLFNAGLVGFEIYSTISKFKQCNQIEKTITDASEQIKVDKIKIEDIQQNITDYMESLNTTYEEQVKSQVTQDEVLEYLRDIKNMTEQASSAASLQTALGVIDKFLHDIKSADEEKTYHLVTNLTEALQRVEFTVECFELKTSTINTVRLRCKQGFGTLREIFDAVVTEKRTNEGKCTTEENIPFTSFEDVKVAIEMYGEVENFNAECKLNDPSLLDNICKDKCSRISDQGMADTYQITVAQVIQLKVQCPSECPLSPQDEIEICQLKSFGLPLANIITVKEAFSEAQVTAAYESCP